MKIQDCWRLAKISLQARKKATKNTVYGMVISLVIIIPFIYAIFGLNISVKAQLNTHPEMLYANFSSTQSGFEVDKSIKDENFFSYGNSYYNYFHKMLTEDRFEGLKQIENDTLHYINIVENLDKLNIKIRESIVINKRNFVLQKFNDNYDEKSELAILSQNSLERFDNLKSQMLQDEYNKGFTGNGARQVILSERYLAMAGLEPKDVYGQKISINIVEHEDEDGFILKMNGSNNLKNSISYKLFDEFEVVGIIGSNFWKNPNSTSGYDNIYDSHHDYYMQIENANIIVSSSSYYKDDGTPAIKHDYYVEDGKLVCDFKDITSKNSMTKDYIFCGANGYNACTIIAEKIENTFTGKLQSVETNIYKYLLENDCTNAYDKITEMLEIVYPLYSDSYSSLESFKLNGPHSILYLRFALIGFFMDIIILVLSIFSIIILLAALINLFNTIMHSVQSRKHYLAMMRAVGAKSKEIPKLYFFEIIRLMSRAFAWIASISAVLCIIVKIIIDKIFSNALGGYVKGFTVSLPWYLIPVTILVFMGLLIVVGMIYAIGCSYKMAYKPIMENLKDS